MKIRLFILSFFLICAWNAAPAQKTIGSWNYIKPEYKGVTWPTCWLRLEAKGDHLYVLYSDHEKVWLVHSEDLGKTWDSEMIEDLAKYPRELEVHKLFASARDEQEREILDQWTKEGHIGVGNWKAEMVVDEGGGLHVAYIMTYSNTRIAEWVVYAYRSPEGEWQKSIPCKIETGYMGYEVDMAVDLEGGRHLIFQRSGEMLHGWSEDGKNWTLHTIPFQRVEGDSVGVNAGVNIDVDSKGKIHASSHILGGYTQYATSRDGGKSWEVEEVVHNISSNSWLDIGQEAQNYAPDMSGSVWFEGGMEVDELDRPHITIRLLESPPVHGVKVDGKWRFSRPSIHAANRSEMFFDGRGGLYIAYYPGYHSMNHMPVRLASTHNHGLDWMDEPISYKAAGVCSGSFADCAATQDRLYVAYHRGDTAVGIAWKPLKEVGIPDPDLKEAPLSIPMKEQEMELLHD